MIRKFKINDKVRIIENKYGSCNDIGDIGTIIEIGDNDCRVQVKGDDPNQGNWSKFNEIELVKKGKPIPEDLTRYMAYGMGCDNKSSLLDNETALKAELKKVTPDSNWTGRIIGYKLIPLYEAEKKVSLKAFKTTKKKATKGKK